MKKKTKGKIPNTHKGYAVIRNGIPQAITFCCINTMTPKDAKIKAEYVATLVEKQFPLQDCKVGKVTIIEGWDL